MDLLQCHARLDGERVAVQIDLAHPVEAGEREDDFAAVGVGDLAADKARIAALRHDRRTGLVGEPDDRGDFLGRAGAQHGGGLAGEQIPPFLQIRRLIGRVGHGVTLADNGDETGDDFVAGREAVRVHAATVIAPVDAVDGRRTDFPRFDSFSSSARITA